MFRHRGSQLLKNKKNDVEWKDKMKDTAREEILEKREMMTSPV